MLYTCRLTRLNRKHMAYARLYGASMSPRHENIALLGVPMKTISHTTGEIWESSSSVIAEDTIKENMEKHEKSIINSLNPSELYSLVCQVELDEEFMDTCLSRPKKAKLLYKEVQARELYFDFLSNLEDNEEHMGHKYLVSLLRGTKFAPDEDIKESQMLFDKIQKNLTLVTRELDVKCLEPYLTKEKLITQNELEKLQNKDKTRKDKAQMLLTILKTKGPTAHLRFVNRCLNSGCSEAHTDLYRLLAVPQNSLKRRASTDTTSLSKNITVVTKRYPFFLETPEGITTSSYIKIMAKIREYHQTGGQNSWASAEELIQKELTKAHSLEVNIALLLESCNPCVLSKNSEEVVSRVERARKMCMVLYGKGSNAQVLEGRCEWVLSRLYKLLGDIKESKTHLDTAFSLFANCQPGEENMLASFMQGCILLDTPNKSTGEEIQTINAFKFVLTVANSEDFGTKISQFCKIRLAQAYIGSSVRSPGKTKEEVPRVNREEAKKVLKDIDQKHMKPRTKCLYFMTRSDVYRTDGQIEEASKYAQQAMTIAQENNLSHEVKYIKKRQEKLLNH